MSAYKEFSGKTVEEALRLAREEFGVELNDLDFEILTPGSRGVLGMGAESARIVAAPRAELGGAAPKRDAAASKPLPAPTPPPAPRDDRPRDDRPSDDRPATTARRARTHRRPKGPPRRATTARRVETTVARAATTGPAATIARDETTVVRVATTARPVPPRPTCPPPRPPRSPPLAAPWPPNEPTSRRPTPRPRPWPPARRSSSSS